MINILQYPHKALTDVSTPFNFENDKLLDYDDIEKFENDMINLMITARGMGLAANQIGITKRFFAFGHGSFDKIKKSAIIWNPSVVRESEEKTLDEEGCLSFLGVFVKIERPKKVTVQWQNKKGETLLNYLDGMESKCFQHELDHLNGITFNTKVSKLKWDMAIKKMEKRKDA
jgi:peptide deformylase